MQAGHCHGEEASGVQYKNRQTAITYKMHESHRSDVKGKKPDKSLHRLVLFK